MNELLLRFGIALGLGMLVGLQRERVGSRVAGLRTFGLVSLFGAVCAHLGLGILAAGLVAVTVLAVLGNVALFRSGEPEAGMTTEVAMVLLYVVGGLVVLGSPELGLAVGGSTAVLLHFKNELHGLVQRMGKRDITSMIQFALLTLVILPVLPDRTFGPYDVLNPQEIWLMVVLIVAISLGGYIGYKLLGERRGAVVGGVLGGLISSTATTVSYARRSRQEGISSRLSATVVLLASAIVLVRVLFEIAVVAPSLLPHAAPPLGILLAVLVLSSLVNLRGEKEVDEEGMPTPGNPTELRSALLFGGLYGLVLLAVAWAREQIGTGGLYVIAVLSGLTDMDAITLSTSRMVEGEGLAAATGWRLIVVASMANLLFKGGVIALWGSPDMRRRIVGWWGLTVVIAGLVLWLWPG